MMKPALTTVLTGAGLLVTWLAMTPANTPPAGSTAPRADRSAPARALTADDLNAEESKLSQHLGTIPLRPSTRNPFLFARPVSAAPQPGSSGASPSAPSAPSALAGPIAPAQPSLSLSGIAERQTPQGRVRTAIISGGGQLYLVTEGESVAGRYRVVAIDSDAVTLRDESGTDTRLALP